MKTGLAIAVTLSALFILGLIASLSCDSLGVGTEVRLEGVTMYMDGKVVSGLPSQKADVVLKVPANKISISTIDQDTVIKLKPSDAIIVVGPNGISITGVDPSQMKINWQSPEQGE